MNFFNLVFGVLAIVASLFQVARAAEVDMTYGLRFLCLSEEFHISDCLPGRDMRLGHRIKPSVIFGDNENFFEAEDATVSALRMYGEDSRRVYKDAVPSARPASSPTRTSRVPGYVTAGASRCFNIVVRANGPDLELSDLQGFSLCTDEPLTPIVERRIILTRRPSLRRQGWRKATPLNFTPAVW